jgi:hypothetical protein
MPKLNKTLTVPLSAWLEANDNMLPPATFNVTVRLADKFSVTGTVVELKEIEINGIGDELTNIPAVVIKDSQSNRYTGLLFDAKIYVPFEVLRIK